MIPVVNMWLSPREAAKKLSVSTDTVSRRGIEWQDSPVPFRMRFKLIVLDESAEGERRYFEPDVEAMLVNPAPRSKGPQLVPTFT
jgi:hypothetical protein